MTRSMTSSDVSSRLLSAAALRAGVAGGWVMAGRADSDPSNTAFSSLAVSSVSEHSYSACA
jgi:hypothetical protein